MPLNSEARLNFNEDIFNRIKKDFAFPDAFDNRTKKSIAETDEDILHFLWHYIERIDLYVEYNAKRDAILKQMKELFQAHRS